MTNVRATFHNARVVLDNIPADARTMAKLFDVDAAEVIVRLFMDKTIRFTGMGVVQVYLWGDRKLIIQLVDNENREVVELFDGIMPDEIRNAADLERMARALLVMFEEGEDE